jgi:hypothetical protein
VVFLLKKTEIACALKHGKLKSKLSGDDSKAEISASFSRLLFLSDEGVNIGGAPYSYAGAEFYGRWVDASLNAFVPSSSAYWYERWFRRFGSRVTIKNGG